MRQTRASRARRRGFTLMEVLLVLAILVILGSFVVMTFTGVLSDSDIKAAQSQIGLFEPALSLYRLNMKEYPSTTQGLEALRDQPSDARHAKRWNGPYVEKELAPDPWGNPYQYQYPGKHNPSSFDLWSLGPDSQEGTEDDIGNWRQE